jgi:hypothetical protein
MLTGLLLWSFIAAPAVLRAATQAADLTFCVQVRPQTSLRVSSAVLRFEVSPATPRPHVLVEFRAAARTARQGVTLLVALPTGALQPPSGADVHVVFTGAGEGTASGFLSATGGPQIVARWTGSGVRQGCLTFMLSGAVAPGWYVLPLDFALTTQ